MATDDELKPEYSREEFGEGVLGKYFERYKQGMNLVLLDPDIAAAFPTRESVNEALRSLVQVAERTVTHPNRSTN